MFPKNQITYCSFLLSDIGMITETGIIGGEVEAEAEAEAWTGVIVIGVVEKGRGKETIADEAGALVLGDLVLITPREGEEDAMMMSEEVVVLAVAEVVAVVVLWTGCEVVIFIQLDRSWEFYN